MIRFGKSSGALLSQKRNFFEDNDALLEASKRVADVYRRQPLREACKCCDRPLGGQRFTKQEIEYILCENCTHLNGAFADTDDFCASLYTDAGGAQYAATYSAADKAAYSARVTGIYVPKAEFLDSALRECGEHPTEMTFADFGAGSGYFVGAMREVGLARSHGYDVSHVQVQLANSMIADGAVVQHELEDTERLAASIAADVVSMIGVLEHVQRPREILQALHRNEQVRYAYISVPLFSPCVMLETVFPNVMQRQLSAGHTHLFTEGSIEWMCREFSLERVAEWWFGTDFVDLYRCVFVELQRSEDTRDLVAHWERVMAGCIDELQLVIDQRKMSSEVHMLLRFA